jgi:hypothetical protein
MVFDSDYSELHELSREAMRLLNSLDITCSQSSSNATKPSSQLENLIRAVNYDVPEVITQYANCYLDISWLSRNDSRSSHSEVGAFYWTVPAPDIVNSGREEQGSVSV